MTNKVEVNNISEATRKRMEIFWEGIVAMNRYDKSPTTANKKAKGLALTRVGAMVIPR